MRKTKIVVIGGGTGLANLLRGLKKEFDNLSAIVTMTDDGRSSGKLRQDYNVLPPGDIRNCIVALADEEQLYHKIFTYRFPHGRGLKGHNLGNLLLVALEDITGSFKKALQEMSKILKIKGHVYPATYEDVILSAKLKNKRVVWGESSVSVAGHRSPIKEVSIHPESAKANEEVLDVIKKADVILIGPGSLYTSVIPNFLFKEITKEVVKSKAKKIFICNVSTERGETEGYEAKDHIDILVKYSDPKIFNICLVNNNLILKSTGKKLGEVKNITYDQANLNGYRVISKDVIDENNPLYHDPIKLVKAIKEIIF